MGKPAAFEITSRTTLHRLPVRGSYEREAAYAFSTRAWFCSVGVVIEGQPYVIPMVLPRLDDELILHGAMASRLLKKRFHGAGMRDGDLGRRPGVRRARPFTTR